MALQYLYVSPGYRPPGPWAQEENFNNCTAMAWRQAPVVGGTVYPYLIGMSLGQTNCCGAKEIWGYLREGDDFVELIKKYPTSIFKYNCPDRDAFARENTTLKQKIESINPKYKGIFQLEVETVSPMEHIIVVNILDGNAFWKWKTTP
jgi:hypothetical protein